LNVAKLLPALANTLLFFCCVPAIAQAAQNQSTHSLLVNVLDRNGNAVRNLSKDSFRVKVNGHPAGVVAADYSLAPRRIVVLLDMSGSMAGETEHSKKWKIAREALEDLLAKTPADVRVALVTFSSRVHDIFDFSQDRSSLTAWLKRGEAERPHVKGTTAVYDAIVAAAKLLQPARPGDAIYAITDGGDNNSQVSPTDTRQLLLKSGIRLFLFLFAEPNSVVQTRVDSVLQLTHETGGFVFGVTGQRGLHFFDFNYDDGQDTLDRIKIYTQALNIQVNGFYTLQLETPTSSKKREKIYLEIVDGTGKVSKDVAWTYPRLFPNAR